MPMPRKPGFIKQHGLWSTDQEKQAQELKRRIEKENLHLIRLAWTDSHGTARAKAVTPPTLLEALEGGYNINVATTTLDSANARTFSSFTRGGGMGLDEMTGSPNIRIVPDPGTFRTLPWATGVGWVLCDEYFESGAPYWFSPRQLLRAQMRRLAEKGMGYVVGLELEWYLLEAAEEHLGEEHQSIPGIRGRPLMTRPPEPGYSYHSESNMDLMQPVLSALAEAYEGLGLGLRSMENEWGPGQVECTFAPKNGLAAADDVLLFRTATKQICRRMGYVATFMCRPALKGYYSSGWHLHQSLVDSASGENVLMPTHGDAVLSPMGMNYLGGLVKHAVECTAFSTPTVNGYRRFQPNSLAPDRVCWAFDHRGVMLRVLGGEGDPASRIENRVGEPAANPYLYMASQVAAGLDGIDNALDPGPSDDEPYTADRTMLPKDLGQALDALESEPLFRAQFGDVFMDYYLKLKRNELGRYLTFLEEQGITQADTGDETTSWEQNEYFDFF